MQNVMVFERGSRFSLFALGPLENDRGRRGPPPRAGGADAKFFTVRDEEDFPRAPSGESSSSAPSVGDPLRPRPWGGSSSSRTVKNFRIRPAAPGGNPLRPGPFPRGPSAKSGKRGSRPFESLFSNEFGALFRIFSKIHSILYAKRNGF